MSHAFLSTLISRNRVFYGNDFFQADWIIPDKRPPDDWPDRGSIVIEEFDLKYREGLPLVLKQINCGVKPGEKVSFTLFLSVVNMI